MNNFQQLLQESERVCSFQKEIIENQTKQIANLEEQNTRLKEQLAECKDLYLGLQSSYDEVIDLCKQQQQILDSLLGSPDT